MATEARVRLDYIDWLRVLAVMVLFIFHSGEIFTQWTFYVMDKALSPVIHGINAFIYQWHMPLFMFLAGMSSYFALNFRSGKMYLKERVDRLLIPLGFGILVVIPPLAYLRMFGDPDMVWHNGFEFNAPGPGYDKNFFEFYPDFFNGIYPNGNFEWGHLWFLAYLFTFSVIILPLFLYLKSEKGRGVIECLVRIVEKPFGIFSFSVPIIIIEVLLRWKFPNFQNLISDWANFFMFITVFLYGFIFISHEAFIHAIEKYWKIALAFGLILSVSISVADSIGFTLFQNEVHDYIFAMIIRGFNIWCCLIGIAGFGKRFLNIEGKFINYASEASLPFYIIHLFFVCLIGFFAIKLSWPIAGKYILIIILSFISAVIFYEFCIRRFNLIRFVFGQKSI